MEKRFSFYDDRLELYGFKEITKVTDTVIEALFKRAIIKVSGRDLYLSYYGDLEAIIKGQVSNIEVTHV